ncbi:MAG: ABC transporter substrate-binding protein [Deltaproteobacteria bacterium]|nr:ABC transporter substrate-binding protein [Deltaproteobacteria bacterium]
MRHPNKIVILFLPLLFLLISCQKEPTQKTATEPAGVTDSEILIGSSCPLTGHASFLGTNYIHGAQSYINYINDKGGIFGRKIRVIAYDDGYDPPRCLFNTQKLINEDKVFALFCYVGTPTSVEIIPIVEEAKIPLLGLFTGANALRNPFRKYIFNIRASYYQEIAMMIKHLVEDRKLTKFAVFYQYDAYGIDGLTGTELALKKYGLEPVATGSYPRGTINVEGALKDIIASEAEAVIMVGTYDPCAIFIKLARFKKFNPVFHNVSFVGGDELARKLGSDGEGVIITQVVPSPDARALLLTVDKYCRLLKKYYPQDEPNYVSFEGYLNAKILVKGLEGVGKHLTRKGFIKSLEGIKDLSIGIGQPINFGPEDHQGFDTIYFSQIKDGKIVLVTAWDVEI